MQAIDGPLGAEIGCEARVYQNASAIALDTEKRGLAIASLKLHQGAFRAVLTAAPGYGRHGEGRVHKSARTVHAQPFLDQHQKFCRQ